MTFRLRVVAFGGALGVVITFLVAGYTEPWRSRPIPGPSAEDLAARQLHPPKFYTSSTVALAHRFKRDWDKRLNGRSVAEHLKREASDFLTVNFGVGPGVSDGRELFLRKWTMDDPLSGEGDGLGPVCNANSCATCHFMGGVGGAGNHKEVMQKIGLNTPPLFGLGLIDRIPDEVIRANVQVSPGLAHGKLSVPTGRAGRGGPVGRFGWKAEFATLRSFVGTAAAVELGLSNEERYQDVPGRTRPDRGAAMDLSEAQLDALVAFCKSLPRPRQILPTNPATHDDIAKGERLFTDFGCARCHTPNLGGLDGVYSDFALHVMGGDKYGYGAVPWKTPPLWGVADSAPYMHDGSARTMWQAILLHRADADDARKRFVDAPPAVQSQLMDFLRTLRAPVTAESCPSSLRGTLDICPGGLMCY